MQLTVQSDTVPSPLDCVVSDANWKLLVALLGVTIPDAATQINFGSQTPIPSRRKYPWIRTNADGTPATPVWTFSNGFWLLPHYTYDPVNDLVDEDRVILWLGNPSQVDTFDGGEPGTVTNISGPMWSILTSMAAKIPIAPGALPSGKVLNVGDTGGEENHVQTAAEVGPHAHDRNTKGLTELATLAATEGGDIAGGSSSGGGMRLLTVATTGGTTGTNTGGQPQNVMPPYYCINFLRKSGRKFYRLPP